MTADLTATLALADWRRRVATLYAEVRALAQTDPEAAHDHWREARDWLYQHHAQSPIPAALRRAFRGLYFAYDPRLRFELPLTPAPGAEAEPVGAVPTSVQGAMSARQVGVVEAPFPAGARRLSVFWLPGYAGGLFLAFRDGTNGAETYGGGRYLLDGEKSADLGGDLNRQTLILDFNFAYHPSCAFDPQWDCPLAPPENRLDLRIEAGERLR